MPTKGLSSQETRMEVSSPNCYDFKKPSVLAPTIGSSHNSANFKNVFLNYFDSCLEYKSVSYTMVYTPYFEEVYLDIRNQSGRLCVTSFLKAGLYCIRSRKQPKSLNKKCIKALGLLIDLLL